MIPQSRPHLSSEDFRYIEDILLSRQVAQGKLTEELERSFSQALGVRHAIAVSHGTAALHLALLALGIGEGDEVIIPSYTCVALPHAVHYTGATPVLVDIDAETFNPTPEMVRSRMSSRSKALILTHTFGFPADIEPITRLGLPIIEDCAQSLGARYQGKLVGAWGQVSIFSFYATKMICSGEGGMVCTNDDRLAERVRDLNTPDKRKMYCVRYNYKMSDLTAGLALSQFRQLESFIQRRREIAQCYHCALLSLPVRMQTATVGSEPVYYRFVIRTDKASVLMRKTREVGIECDRPVYNPLHRYLEMGNLPDFENTEIIWESGVSVPIYPDLSDQEVSHIVSTLSEACRTL